MLSFQSKLYQIVKKRWFRIFQHSKITNFFVKFSSNLIKLRHEKDFFLLKTSDKTKNINFFKENQNNRSVLQTLKK